MYCLRKEGGLCWGKGMVGMEDQEVGRESGVCYQMPRLSRAGLAFSPTQPSLITSTSVIGVISGNALHSKFIFENR